MAQRLGHVLGPRAANDRGQTFAEYSLILAFIAVVAVGGYAVIAGPISGAINSAGSAFP